VVLRDWCMQFLATGTPEAAVALARGFCTLLSAQTGVEGTAIWEWGFFERVSSGLYCLDLGIEEVGWPCSSTLRRCSFERMLFRAHARLRAPTATSPCAPKGSVRRTYEPEARARSASSSMART
jgi:hypothetical protein